MGDSLGVFDFSWSAIPRHRLGLITTARALPRGYLLGGSGRPSKLAALAAARKRAQEQKKQVPPNGNRENDEERVQTSEASSVALLDKLSLRGKGAVGSEQDIPDLEQNPEVSPGRDQPGPRRYKRQKVEEEPPEPHPSSEALPETSKDRSDSSPRVTQLQATPSMFASVLTGAPSRSGAKQQQLQSHISLRHQSKDPFAEPSPDDRVNTAQTKGSKRA